MVQRNKIGRNYPRALELAKAHGVDFDTDFHAQSFGPWLSELARGFGYRAPKNGSASTGRHFFYLLKRLHDNRSEETTMTTATETQLTITASPWQWANDTPVWLRPRRTVYFLVRHVGDNHNDWSTGKVEYRSNRRGHTITYRTREQAIRIQNRLNTEGQR